MFFICIAGHHWYNIWMLFQPSVEWARVRYACRLSIDTRWFGNIYSDDIEALSLEFLMAPCKFVCSLPWYPSSSIHPFYPYYRTNHVRLIHASQTDLSSLNNFCGCLNLNQSSTCLILKMEQKTQNIVNLNNNIVNSIKIQANANKTLNARKAQ